MALIKVANGNAPRGVWTFCYEAIGSAESILVHVPDVPQAYPVPAFYFAECYEDVLNTTELVYTRPIAQGNRTAYGYIEAAGSQVWIYVEKHSPLPPILAWEIWRYDAG